MSQTTYSHKMAVGLKGGLAQDPHTIKAYQAGIALPYGRGVAQHQGYANQCRLPIVNQVTLQFAGDLAGGATVDMDINGVAIAQVTYAVSHLNTMGLIRAQILLNADVLDCTIADANSRSLVIRAVADTVIAVSGITIGGGGPALSNTPETYDLLLGVTAQTAQTMLEAGQTEAQVALGRMVDVLKIGAIFVYVETAVAPDNPVFLRFIAGGATELVGQFRNTSDSGKAVAVTGARFETTTPAGGIAILSVNLA